MRKKTIINIFHYFTKYLIILFPLILVILSPFVKNESFIGSSEFDITYKYQTNLVASASDLVVGNAYNFNIENYDNESISNVKLNLTVIDYENYSNVSSLTFMPYVWNNENNNIVGGGNDCLNHLTYIYCRYSAKHLNQ